MMQDLHFYSDGIKLAAELHTPDDMKPGERRPGIVICHGFGGNKKFFLPEFARAFISKGYVALTFDYRGFGESDGPKWRLIPQEQCRDIVNAISFLQGRDCVDPTRVGLYGTSAGGGNVCYVAATDKRVKATVCTVGYGDGARWLHSIRRHWEWCEFVRRVEADRLNRVATGESEWVTPEEIMVRDPEAQEHENQLRAKNPGRSFKLPLETGDAIINFKPVEFIHQVAPNAIMFVGVTEDWLIPTDETLDLYARASEPKELLMMPRIGHHGVYYGDHIGTVLNAASDFYSRHL